MPPSPVNKAVTATTPLLPTTNPGNSSLASRMNNTYTNLGPAPTSPVAHGDFRLLEEPEPTFASSFKFFACSSYLNYLLVFVPLGVIAELLHWPGTVVFCLNFIALVPLAKILGLATEEIALRTNETIGGLLNATFGNAVEMILCVIALQNKYVRVVQASLLGSILSNLLFVMGFSFLMGGMYYPEQKFNETAAQTGASILAVTVMAWVIPAVFANVDESPQKLANILTLSRATAVRLFPL
jgi:Ca2+:H+ antiporter